MIIEISIAVIAVAFLFLVIYLILLFRSLKTTLGQINLTLSDFRQHFDEIGNEAKKMTFDMNYKMESFNSIFKAISNIGDYLEQKSKSVKLEAEITALRNESLSANRDSKTSYFHSTHGPHSMLDQVASIFELIGQGYRLWQDVNKRR